MTINELTKKLNPLNDSFYKYVLKELLKKHSKLIVEDADIFFEKNKNIDFDYNKFLKDFNRVVIKNYPVEYITNKKFFYNKTHYIKKGVLIPRQETEFIVDWIIKNKLLINSKKIADFCSGSGVIANTLSSIYKNIEIYGIEKYKIPFDVCNKNKKILNTNVSFIKNDIFKLKKSFLNQLDAIICNPPYIAKNDNNVDISTKYEPKNALFAKEDGLYFYKKILETTIIDLKSGCQVICEIGFNQKTVLEKLLISNKHIKKFLFIKDLDDNYRIMYFVKK